MRNPLVPFVLLAVLSVMILSCARQEGTGKRGFTQLKAPLPELDPRFSDYTIATQKDTTLTLSTGTRIVIPALAFVDEQCNPVSGNVTLRVREFPDALAAWLAGIPMDVKTPAGRVPFVTAGSLQLEAEADKPLSPEFAKPVRVDVVQRDRDAGFDLYRLSSESGEWDLLDKRNWASLKTSETAQLGKKKKESRYLALNYLSILDVYFQDDYTKFSDSILKPKLEAYSLAWADNFTRDWITWKGNEYPANMMVWRKAERREFPAWTRELPVAVRAATGGNFIATITSPDSTRHFSILLTPVMPLKDLFAFSPKDWDKNFNRNMAKIQLEADRQATTNALYRSFIASKMGVYNWDKLLQASEKAIVAASFQFPLPVNPKLNDISVVWLSGDRKSVATYHPDIWQQLPLVKQDGALLFAVMPGNSLAVYPADAYAKLPIQAWAKENNPPANISLTARQVRPGSTQELYAALGLKTGL